MSTPNDNERHFDGFHASRTSGELRGPDGVQRLEPKVMELLFLFTGEPGRVFSRDEILAQLWPGVVVGEESLARAVSKLRKALGDDARAPRHIETIPKRGYRFVSAETVSAVTASRRTPSYLAAGLLAGLLLLLIPGLWIMGNRAPEPDAPAEAVDDADALVARGRDYYFQYTRNDNETAISLFERAIHLTPHHAPAFAGLANALGQRVLRWPDSETEFFRLRDALENGHTRAPAARLQLDRALLMARRAVALDPDDDQSHKALGFILSLQEAFPEALNAYDRAIALNPDAWGAMINTGDLHQITGETDEAVSYFERAFDAMSRAYKREPARILPWQSELGVLIAETHLAQGRRDEAERWYRRVLEIAPLHEAGHTGLVQILVQSGRDDEAALLCANLAQRTGANTVCANLR